MPAAWKLLVANGFFLRILVMVNLSVRPLWAVLLAWAVHATVLGTALGQAAGPLDISVGVVGTLQLAALDDSDRGDGQLGDEAPAVAADVGITGDFVRNSWVMTTYGSVRIGDKGMMYTGHVGVGYHLRDDFSVNLEAIGGIVDVESDTSGGMAELDLVLRWHFAKNDDWSIYADLGMGIISSGVSVPRGGTHFNFTPQVGLGATIDLSGKAKMIVGARYIHLSNARIQGASNNPAWDGGLVYIGLMFPL